MVIKLYSVTKKMCTPNIKERNTNQCSQNYFEEVGELD